MPTHLYIGLMSGTSVDGIDAALVEVSGKLPRPKVKVRAHVAMDWPRALRDRLLAVMAPATTTTQELCQLNMLVAKGFAAAVFKLLAKAGVKASDITAIGSHGQTVCHLPPPNDEASTLQLGDPSVLSVLTGIPVVGNFRPADVAVGGQGAPLVPWTDAVMLTHPKLTRCTQNVGGIGNVTYLPPGGRGDVLAFDTGPGNMLIDALVTLATDGKQTFDKGGKLAASGKLNAKLFRTLQAHPYFDRKPPKTTGREDFGALYARKIYTEALRGVRGASRSAAIHDLIHTATYLTAWSIVDAYLRFLPETPHEIILCGGGAHNPTIVAMLRDEWQRIRPERQPKIGVIDDYGIPNKAKEAASFALLAVATLAGVPANVPSVTGAERGVVLGCISGMKKS